LENLDAPFHASPLRILAGKRGGILSSTKNTSAVSNDLLGRAIAYVRTGKGLEDRTVNVVGLDMPVGGDADERVRQVRHIVKLLEKYHAEGADRPLSIAVFGPPGSGKSTFVKMISKAVAGCKLVKTANLTQIAGTEELAKIFEILPDLEEKEHTSPSAGTAVTPVFFFDEFDAALEGAPLGWLRWFLAPMQDGKVLINGVELKIGKAVFMFAGGTAETLDEFNRRAQLDQESYRARKVPDFVSRLRGAIDIGGVNEPGDARIVPRALVLRRLLAERQYSLNEEFIGQFLSNGHFVHGVRSMITLLEAGWSENGELDLPEAIRRQHFSRGELDGHLVGISAGLKETGSNAMFSALTKQLLRSGAALAYAGAFAPEGTLEQVLRADHEAPPELGGRADRPPRVRNYLGHPASLQAENWISRADRGSVEFIPLKTVSACELEELGAPTEEWFSATVEPNEAYDPRRHVAWALSLFRLRVRMLQDVSALVVLGGKDDGLSWGRVAGIAEEVMIALALCKPVFVLGGAGGAARAVGQLLGLDESPVGIKLCLTPPANAAFAHALAPYSQSFEICGEPDSPLDLAALRRFLFHRGVTTAAWPWNGLSQEENRQLFACPISDAGEPVERAVELILQGLSRVDWKPVGDRRSTVRSGEAVG
jgi:hypothetical protein